MEGGASRRVRALKENAVLVGVTIGLKSELKSMDGAIVDSDGKLSQCKIWFYCMRIFKVLVVE
jgi:hypothetical protein